MANDLSKYLYLLIECVQNYINECNNAYSQLDPDDEQYKIDCKYFEEKTRELFELRSMLFDMTNGGNND